MAFSAIILAAGKGTRMKGDLPKVAFSCAGAPMVRWVADACRAAGCERIVVVVGYRQEVVRDIFAADAARGLIEFAEQREQLGTGHAVMAAAGSFRGATGQTLVLAGDGPLIEPSTLRRLADLQRSTGAAAALATTTLADPTGYGRIVRDAAGRFERIVEQKNATEEQKRIREVYPSICCFDTALLFETLPSLPRDPVGGEHYVTAVPEMLVRSGRRVELLAGVAPEEAMGVNTPEELARVEAALLAKRPGIPAPGIAGTPGMSGIPAAPDRRAAS